LALGSVRKLCSYARQSVDCPPSGDGSYGGIRVFSVASNEWVAPFLKELRIGK
jgi:hypothetical protein